MIEYLRSRRSVRKYKAKKIETEKIEILKEALLRSPSSRDFRPWEFILVDDRELLIQLSQSKPHGADFLKDAALGIVICGDETKSDVWVEDCSIAAILVQMVAQSLGLGSCWIQIRQRAHVTGISSEQYIQNILDLREKMKVECIISLGYPAEKKKGVPREKLDWTKLTIA